MLVNLGIMLQIATCKFSSSKDHDPASYINVFLAIILPPFTAYYPSPSDPAAPEN